jgi:predicted HAD superfamily phosphohydrolase YqeG
LRQQNLFSCRFSKKTGIPFKKIKAKYKNCLLIADSQTDFVGAKLAQIPALIIKPGQKSLVVDEWITRLHKSKEGS